MSRHKAVLSHDDKVREEASACLDHPDLTVCHSYQPATSSQTHRLVSSTIYLTCFMENVGSSAIFCPVLQYATFTLYKRHRLQFLLFIILFAPKHWYTLRLALKVHPYYFCDYSVECRPIFIIFSSTVAKEICN